MFLDEFDEAFRRLISSDKSGVNKAMARFQEVSDALEAHLDAIARGESNDSALVGQDVKRLQEDVMRKKQLLQKHRDNQALWKQELSTAVEAAENVLLTLPPLPTPKQ